MPTRKKRTPARGKRFVKVVKNKKTGRTRKVSYGQAGKSKSGKDRIQPGTKKGDSYCARSAGIKKRLSAKKRNDPNSPNNLSRKKWKCRGKRFVKVVKNKKTGRTRKVSYGQAGKSKSGKDRIQPGTKKGDSYCARSAGIKKRLSAKKRNDPNSPNNLSRKKWKCRGKKSMR